MAAGERTFVGFGFGPIQSALFLYEAYHSGNFGRYVIAEVDADLVRAVRAGGGRYSINIAHPDRIEQVTVDGVRLCDPAVTADRQELVAAIAAADELATALPSVRFYDAGQDTSVVNLLSEGFQQRDPARPAVLYAAENHNHAAEILGDLLNSRAADAPRAHVQLLNTVVGKMSGILDDEAAIRRLGLAPLTPDSGRAVLVERFNHILVSRVTLPGFRRGIEVFVEKDDLLPFEEAKLYGHNAIHSLIGYLARERGLTTMAEAAHNRTLRDIARAAFIDESGAALIRKYRQLEEPLFTPDGYRAYAEDLIQRMVNPYLNDQVARVTRDPQRKLGYDDRLFGTMRLCLDQGITPVQMAQGAAAALRAAAPHPLQSPSDVREFLDRLWGPTRDQHAPRLIQLTWQALQERA